MTAKTLINAQPIEVSYRDGSKEKIELHELTIRQLYKWIERFAESDTPALVALSTGRDAAWVDTLDDTSFAEVGAAAIRLNFPRAETMMSQDVTVAARLIPTLRLLADVEQLTVGRSSLTRSPAPAVSGSAAEIGSASSS